MWNVFRNQWYRKSRLFNVRRCFDDVVWLDTSKVVPVLVVAAAERVGLADGAAAEVDTWHVVDDCTDVRELHVLLSQTLASTAVSRLQLSLFSCCPHQRALSTHFLLHCVSCTSFHRAMLCITRTLLSQDICLSVCQSLCPFVTRRYSVETASTYHQFSSPLDSHAILVFPHQTVW